MLARRVAARRAAVRRAAAAARGAAARGAAARRAAARGAAPWGAAARRRLWRWTRAHQRPVRRRRWARRQRRRWARRRRRRWARRWVAFTTLRAARLADCDVAAGAQLLAPSRHGPVLPRIPVSRPSAGDRILGGGDGPHRLALHARRHQRGRTARGWRLEKLSRETPPEDRHVSPRPACCPGDCAHMPCVHCVCVCA